MRLRRMRRLRRLRGSAVQRLLEEAAPTTGRALVGDWAATTARLRGCGCDETATRPMTWRDPLVVPEMNELWCRHEGRVDRKFPETFRFRLTKLAHGINDTTTDNVAPCTTLKWSKYRASIPNLLFENLQDTTPYTK